MKRRQDARSLAWQLLLFVSEFLLWANIRFQILSRSGYTSLCRFLEMETVSVREVPNEEPVNKLILPRWLALGLGFFVWLVVIPLAPVGYPGQFLCLRCVMIFYDSFIVFIGFVVLCVIVNFFILPREERALEERFGESFRKYKKTTPRWLGRIRH